MQAKRIVYDHKRRLEAEIRSDITVTNKRIAYIDLEEETISFVCIDVPLQVLKDIVNNWNANLRASQEAFPEDK